MLNRPNAPPGDTNVITVGQLNATEPDDDSLKTIPDMKFFIRTDFVPNRNPTFYNPTYYPWEAFPPAGQIAAATLNGIAFNIPQYPVLTQHDDIPPEDFCNSTSIQRNCSNEFCECIHRIQAQLGQVVEIILYGTGIKNNSIFKINVTFAGNVSSSLVLLPP